MLVLLVLLIQQQYKYYHYGTNLQLHTAQPRKSEMKPTREDILPDSSLSNTWYVLARISTDSSKDFAFRI